MSTSVSNPAEPVPPAQPVQAPPEASILSLKALAKAYKKEGKRSNFDGDSLRGFVLGRLIATNQWKNANQAERASALNTVPAESTVAASTSESATPMESAKEKLTQPYGKIAILGVVLLLCLVVGYQLIKLAVSFLLGSFASSIGATIPPLTGGWAALKGGTIWILLFAAFVIGLLALLAYRKNRATQLPTSKLWVFGIVILIAGILSAYPSGAAIAAQAQQVHGSPVVLTGSLLEICQQEVPKGDFSGTEDVNVCGNRLSNAARMTTTGVPEKKGYRGLSLSSYLLNCGADPSMDIKTVAGRTKFGQCADEGILVIYGQQVKAAVDRLDQ